MNPVGRDSAGVDQKNALALELHDEVPAGGTLDDLSMTLHLPAHRAAQASRPGECGANVAYRRPKSPTRFPCGPVPARAGKAATQNTPPARVSLTMSGVVNWLSTPRVAKYIRFSLDECLPPILRDQRWFYRPILWLYNRRMDPDFKAKASAMTADTLRQAYEALVPMRATDLTPSGLRFAVENVIGRTVLEVGCGNGDVSLACARAGYEVTATDLAEGNLRQVSARAASLNLTLQTAVVDVERLPLPNACFDSVLCLHTLEHVLDIHAAVSELKRVARKRLIVIVPRERYYRYACNYHLHFFGGCEQLALLLGLRTFRCELIEGQLCYVGDLTDSDHSQDGSEHGNLS
jgi:SAM-dependent methyltransferase